MHLTVQQPYGLKNLQPEFMQVTYMYLYGVPYNELGSTESKVIFLVIFLLLRRLIPECKKYFKIKMPHLNIYLQHGDDYDDGNKLHWD